MLRALGRSRLGVSCGARAPGTQGVPADLVWREEGVAGLSPSGGLWMGPAWPCPPSALSSRWPLQRLHLHLGALLLQLQREGQEMRAACCELLARLWVVPEDGADRGTSARRLMVLQK